MNMVFGALPNQAGSGTCFWDGAGSCEGCDGSGIRCPAEPSCAMPDLSLGSVIVERCDYCQQYPDDLAAAEVVCDDPTLIRCESGGVHAVGRLVSTWHSR